MFKKFKRWAKREWKKFKRWAEKEVKDEIKERVS